MPEAHWHLIGIYSWLERRADQAFKMMRASDKEIVMGRLRYAFEYTDQGPQLKMIALMPATSSAWSGDQRDQREAKS